MYSNKPKLHRRQQSYKAGTLRTVAIDVTERCNMQCAHCYAETFANKTPISISQLGQAISEFCELGAFHFVLQGGEPVTDPERLDAVLKFIPVDEAYINVVTNGWAMSPDMVEWLKNRKVDKIAFSLDSGLEAEHDVNRKRGSFKKVLEGIHSVKKSGLLTSISTVVTHDSLYSEGFRKALALAISLQIRLDIQIAMPVGKWDANEKVLITEEDASHIKRLQGETGRLPNGQYLINRDIFNYGGCDHCPAGVEFMAITANGNVLPCNFAQFTLGLLGSRSICSMREAIIENRWFQGKHPRCLIGEDRDFISRFILPYRLHTKPLDAYDLFELRREDHERKI